VVSQEDHHRRDVEITKAQLRIPVLNPVQNPSIIPTMHTTTNGTTTAMRAPRSTVNRQDHGRLIEAAVDEDVVVWLVEEGIIILEAGGSILLLVELSPLGLARHCLLLPKLHVLQHPN
jgi:hypothetical protein